MRLLVTCPLLFLALPFALRAQTGSPVPGYNAALYPDVLAAAKGVAKPFLLQQGYQTMSGLTVSDTTLQYNNQQFKVEVRYQNPSTGYYLPAGQYAAFGTQIFAGIWPQQLPNIVYDSAQRTYRGISDCVGYITRLLSATGDTGSVNNPYIALMDAVHGAGVTLFAYRGYVATAYQFGAAFPTLSANNPAGWQYICGSVLADSINTYNHSVRPNLGPYTGQRRGGFAASKAGDLLAFSYSPGSSFNGHVMVLEKAPRLLSADSIKAYMPSQSAANIAALMNKYKVYETAVFDCSGQSAHFRDSRSNRSGVGHGSLLLLTAHSDDAPVGFIFSPGSVTGSTIRYDSLGTGIYAISVGRWRSSSTAAIGRIESELPCAMAPNPAGNELQLRFESSISGTASVLDMSGRLLRNERMTACSQLNLDLRGMPAGTYMLVVMSGERTFRKQFSKR